MMVKNMARNNLQLGNKAYYLTKIADECSVPNFFTLETSTFKKLLDYSQNLELKELIIQAFLNKLGIISKLEEIRTGIDNMYIPKEFEEEVFEQLEINDIKEPFAVRSSSTAEDGNKNSGAGIYESYCDVTKEQLIQKIKECWKSNFSLRSLCYEEMDDDVEKKLQSMGVIIQHYLHNADFSGVMFTTNPISPETGAFLEFVRGTSENLMSGMAVSESQSLGFCNEGIGREQYKFKYPWMYDLLHIGSRLKSIIGCEADLEWVVIDNKVYIIQCRPVTTGIASKASEWIYPIAKVNEIPISEQGGLKEYLVRCKKKKAPFYAMCEKTSVKTIGWYILRYSKNSDIKKYADYIVEHCGKGHYAVMLNKVLTDFQCIDSKLEDLLKEIIEMTSMEYITVSVKYIPHNEMSCISYYDKNTGKYRVEAVPGIMKGVKSGYLVPTIFVLDENFTILDSKDVFYKTCYDIDMDTDTFIEPEINKSIYSEIEVHVNTIAKGTKELYEEGVKGAVEWWICDGKLFVTDYSMETQGEESKGECVEDYNVISTGEIKGNLLVLNGKYIEDLEYLSYGCSISVDHYDDRVHEIEAIKKIEALINERKLKNKNEKIILVVDKPYLGLSPILSMVNGVIFRNASRLCHLSVILREKKIPAIEYGDLFDQLKDDTDFWIAG